MVIFSARSSMVVSYPVRFCHGKGSATRRTALKEGGNGDDGRGLQDLRRPLFPASPSAMAAALGCSIRLTRPSSPSPPLRRNSSPAAGAMSKLQSEALRDAITNITNDRREKNRKCFQRPRRPCSCWFSVAWKWFFPIFCDAHRCSLVQSSYVS